MNISERGLDLIKRYESFSPTPYHCPAGKLTIGYGHVILTGENYSYVTEAVAREILRKDVQKAERAVLNALQVAPTQGQFDAMVSLTFNIGASAFRGSTLVRLFNEHKTLAAGQEFVRWISANNKKLKGLLIRRAEEILLYTQAEEVPYVAQVS